MIVIKFEELRSSLKFIWLKEGINLFCDFYIYSDICVFMNECNKKYFNMKNVYIVIFEIIIRVLGY